MGVWIAFRSFQIQETSHGIHNHCRAEDPSNEYVDWRKVARVTRRQTLFHVESCQRKCDRGSSRRQRRGCRRSSQKRANSVRVGTLAQDGRPRSGPPHEQAGRPDGEESRRARRSGNSRQRQTHQRRESRGSAIGDRLPAILRRLGRQTDR